MSYQGFAPAYPMEAQPPQQYLAQPQTWQGQPRQAPPAPAAVRSTVAPLPAPRVICAQSDDEPVRQPIRETRPTSLQLPAPEQLGVNSPPSGTDWARVHQRLEQMGAVCFHLDKLSTGNYRVSCVLPSQTPDRTRHIDVEAGSKDEAVTLALAKAEEWRSVRNTNHP